MGVCNCSMFCCTLLYVHSSTAIILMGKRKLIALLLSSWCLVMVERLFLVVQWGCLRFVVVVFPDHTHLLFLGYKLFCNKVYQNLYFIVIYGDYPHAFLKKRGGYCNRLRPSVRPSVHLSVRPSITLSPPKPLDEIQLNLVCGLLT